MLKWTLEGHLRRSLSRVYSHSRLNLSVSYSVIDILIILVSINTEEKLK